MPDGPDWTGLAGKMLDDLLRALENPTRRRILEKLAEERHYPLQLSRELRVSQQAIVKHLKVLEEVDLVEASREKSDAGGPPRKSYGAKRPFTLYVDFGTSLFDAGWRPLDAEAATPGEFEEIEERRRRVEEVEEPQRRLSAYAALLSRINEELGELEARRAHLVQLKDLVLQDVRVDVGEFAEDYVERRVLYYLLDEGPSSLREMSRRLDLQERRLRGLLKKWGGVHLVE